MNQTPEPDNDGEPFGLFFLVTIISPRVSFGRANELMMAVVRSLGPAKPKNKNKKHKFPLEKDMSSRVTSRHQTDPGLRKIYSANLSLCHVVMPHTRVSVGSACERTALDSSASDLIHIDRCIISRRRFADFVRKCQGAGYVHPFTGHVANSTSTAYVGA